ncbi:MAG TPA: hypothetical protein VI039_13100 [Solirubrobacterales bacterium]
MTPSTQQATPGTVGFQVGDQVEHDRHGRGEIVWVYRAGVLVEFVGEDTRHLWEYELKLVRKGRS